MQKLRANLANMSQAIICEDVSKKGKKYYYNKFATWDIEATNETQGETKFAIPYLWTFYTGEDYYLYGRTIEEFCALIKLLPVHNDEIYFVVYVHNLAYEWQYIRKYFDWENDDVFLLGNRKPLYARYKMVEFRCSYMLSNMALSKFLENNHVECLKLDYDYTKKRYPWDELTDYDYEYCSHDTIGLHQAIMNTLEKDGDTIATIPLTSTGYVRQDVKRALTPTLARRVKLINTMDADLYTALNCAFVGGNTHANRHFVGEKQYDVNCYDITSSYPFAQITGRFPMYSFRKLFHVKNFQMDEDFAYVLKVEFEKIRLINDWDGMVQISQSKCLEKARAVIDNGRILQADRIVLWCTDIELSIINNHYCYDGIEVLDGYYSMYGEIPTEIKSVIYTYFRDKCELKGKDDYLYMKQKNKLNSIYGMSAFDVGKRRFAYESGEYTKDMRELSEILEDMTQKTRQAEPYAWGVWTTAIARKNLDEVVRMAGDRFIYCDTDSVYCLGALDLSEINRRKREASKEYAVGGKYLGVWEHDKYCKEFISLGAKKYCYVNADGEVKTVTAGVSKKAGVKDINDYVEGHIFRNATNKSWYEDEGFTYTIQGHEGYIPSSVHIEPSDYTLGIGAYYNALLMAIKGDMDFEQVFFE